MDYKLGFAGPYVTAVELGTKEPTLTISKVELTLVDAIDPGKPAKDRIIVHFKEARKGWVLNRTNAECLVAMWGRDTEGWIGKRVTLYATRVRVGPKMEPGIRVKGSPDLDKPLTFDLKLPRKKAISTTLVPTGKGAAA